MDLSVSYIYGEAWTFTKKHGLKIAAMLLFSLLITFAVSLIGLPSGFLGALFDAILGNTKAIEKLAESAGPNVFATIAQYAIQFAITAATYALLIGCIRGNRTSLIGAFKLRPMTYVKFIAVEFLYAIIVIAGLFLLIVPGIYFGVRFAWAPYYVVEHEDASIIDAMKWSWAASDDRVLELLGLALIAIVVIVVVSIVGFMFLTASLATNSAPIIDSLAVVLIAFYLAASAFVSFAQAMAYTELGNKEF